MMKPKTKFKQTEIGMIPEDWEIKSLEQVAVFKNGKSSPKRDIFGKFPVYGSNGIIGFVSETNSDENTIVIGRVGAYCGSVYFSKTKSWITDNAIIGYTKSNNSSRFLFYLLKKLQLNKHRGGSSQPLLNQSVLYSLKAAFPTIKEEQSAIAKILSDLDSKIELNQQMNKTLEAIGQAIFKHWFVDFEFPNEEGKPYKSSGGEMVYNEELGKEIPIGWEYGKLGDTLSLLKDGSHNPPKRIDSGIRFIAGASDLKHFEINFENCSYISKEDYEKMHKYWKIQPRDVLLTIVGTIGNVAIVKKEDLPFSMQRSIAILRSNDKLSQNFLYFLLNTSVFKQFLNSHVNPTAQPGIYLGTLSTASLIIPTKEVVKQFDRLVEPIIIRMQYNNNEVKNLSQIRDAILPKLMSGKIRVPVEA